MILRCICQHLPEQFRRIISSNLVIVLTGCSRGWPSSVARESQKAGITTKFCHLSVSGVGLGAIARYSSSCSLLETSKLCRVGSGSQRNFPAQKFSPLSSSRVLAVGFEKLGARHFSSAPPVSTMGQKKEREAKELNKGPPELKKGNSVWKEKRKLRNVSTTAELCGVDAETTAKAGEKNEGTDSPANPNGAPTSEPDSTASAEKADEDAAERITKEVRVDAMLLRFLVGKGGSTKEKIEKDCKVKLKVPSTYEAKTCKSGCTITGTDGGIEAAEKRIKAILGEAVQSKLQYTHFISLPLAIYPDLLEQVEKFQERILARNEPTTATSSSGGEPGASGEDKVDVTDKEKDAVNGEDVKSPKAEIVETQREKDLILDEAKAGMAETPEMKKRPFEEEKEEEVKIPNDEILESEGAVGEKEVKSHKCETMDTEEGNVGEVDKDLKAEILGMEKGVLRVETVSKNEVTHSEKGVVELKVIPHKSGIDKSIFVKPRTFHLTVLMLKLWNEERVQQAAEVLEKTQAAVQEALEGKSVLLDFKGVEIMRGKPEKAHVLFARVEDSAEKTRLLKACQVLIDAYVESGLVMEKDIGQALKLHATLMNTTNRTVKKNHRFGKRIPFDATEILEQYGGWKWGEFGIQEAHLSQRFVYGEDGYYHCVKSIPLPAQPLSSSVQVASTLV